MPTKHRKPAAAAKATPAPIPVVEKVMAITADEQAIAARVAAESREWETIGEESVLDYSLGRDAFEFPPPAKAKYQAKEFSFRWIVRTTKRMDEVRNKPVPFRWWICNSTNTPFLEGFFDPVLGCVCREDQMLVFKPWWMRDKEKAYKEGLAAQQDQRAMVNKDGQPTDSGIQWRAGKRSIDGEAMGHEVRGADVVMADESILDERAGVRHSEAGSLEITE
jgi:hypothetical protein